MKKYPCKASARVLAGHYLPDLRAGLSVAGLLVPEAIAYSTIANLPPQTGVIALLAGLVAYGLLGNSRFAIVSATSSSAAVVAAVAVGMAGDSLPMRMLLAAGLVLITGLIFVSASLARLGSASEFIAKPVLRGYAFGLAIVIIIRQIPSFLGVSLKHTDSAGFLIELARSYPQWNVWQLATGLVALVLLFAFGRSRQVPGAFVVISLGIVASRWFGLHAHGVSVVGTIELSGQMPSLPSLDHHQWAQLGEFAFALALILYAESYSSIRTLALKHGDLTVPNRELLALGAANMLSGLFHGLPVGAGYSASATSEAAGAQSRWAGWFAAVVVAVIMLPLLPLVALTPTAVLAAVVCHALSHALNPSVFTPYLRLHRDRILVAAAVLAVLVLGVLYGLLAAIGLSLLMLLRGLSVPNVSTLGRLGEGHDFLVLAAHSDARPVPGVIVLRPEAPLFFGNVEVMMQHVRTLVVNAGDSAQSIVLSLEESPDLDSTSVEALMEFERFAAARGKRLFFARLKEPALALLTLAGMPGLTPSYVHYSVDDAVAAALAQSS
ncbi:SulP family inorganic anion transporter [Cupriavidus necator]|nr:SulP family inorganic anion transporter [Cupriavidus necator]MDX6007907.1 SulP family inorganic anion transporter [Cupriavidus necator]